MKAIILLGLMFFMSITLVAQETDREYAFSLTNIETSYKEVVPALSIEVTPKSLNGFDFVIAYVSELFTKNILQKPTEVKNPQMQNMYVAMNYKF